MYKLYPTLVLGFHACEHDVADAVLGGQTGLRASRNKFDWLGHGIYFWENSPDRARQWGQTLKERGRLTKPTVIGAVIALGRCFDLLESSALTVLRQHYDALIRTYELAGRKHEMPANQSVGGSADLLLRNLDCAVIEYMHTQIDIQAEESQSIRPFDSVRGAFWEGDDLYPNAGFKSKSHIQVCVRNINCIKGYFRPLEPDHSASLV